MLQPADLLILDEPTNDLDIPTLEVLEETLAEFPGALVLVTRDRFLLERVSTVILALDGVGGATFYADYAQWETARDSGAKNAGEGGDAPARPSIGAPTKIPSRGGLDVRRLTYLEKREWDQMEQAILEAEQALAASRRAVDDPEVASDPVALGERWAALQAAQAAVDRLYERWAELEQQQR
jgi:ATP-binding cassette subfamily F protein uup